MSLILPPSVLQATKVILPGSKSISNRVLLLSALSQTPCTLNNLLDSEDTQMMKQALQKLGIQVMENNQKITVIPAPFSTCADLFLGNAGTAFRPLTAILALSGGTYTLDGVARMRERPIGDLVDALRMIGAQIDYLGQEGYPPLRIRPFVDNGVRQLSVRGSVSSQFLSALLMALPQTQKAYEIVVEGDLISRPYIDITLNLINKFGISIKTNAERTHFKLPVGQCYRAPETWEVEGDASGASYFLAAGLLGNAPITVEGIDKNSIQGDIAFIGELEKIGAQVLWGEHQVTVSRARPICAFDIDANAIPDAAMTLAIVALAANGPCRIRNIASWRVKETDRINAMACELRKVGASVETTSDSIRITPSQNLRFAAIDTYDDHRMAMCFSLICLMNIGVEIRHPECVNKTFPDYFDRFRALLA